MPLELAENYPVDGFFFDCLGAYPCVCEYCVKEMKEKGIDITDTEAVTKFSAFSAHRMCEYLNEAIRRVKPDALLFFNGRPFEEVIHMESHLECECLPTAGWGYECLPICAHYMRTVAGPDKSVLNMTGRFNDWGDFGGLRTAEGLEYDLFYGAANGQRPDIGGAIWTCRSSTASARSMAICRNMTNGCSMRLMSLKSRWCIRAEACIIRTARESRRRSVC